MIIAVDIGGTKTRISYSRIGNNLDDSLEFVTPKNQRVVIKTIQEKIKLLIGTSEVDAIGISSPGPIDKKRGMILSPRNLSWNNLKIVKPLKDHFDCPVILEHDATAGGIAEARAGSAKKYRVVLYISLSTGIGSSIILDGSPLPTAYNQEGGRQIIGSDPALDRFGLAIGGKAIQQRFGKIAQDIHDPHIWQIIAQEFALGIFNMITIVNPDCVVLGGGVSVHYRRFIRPLKKQLLSLGPIYPLPDIVKARYAQTAPSLGVMFLAIEELKIANL